MLFICPQFDNGSLSFSDIFRSILLAFIVASWVLKFPGPFYVHVPERLFHVRFVPVPSTAFRDLVNVVVVGWFNVLRPCLFVPFRT